MTRSLPSIIHRSPKTGALLPALILLMLFAAAPQTISITSPANGDIFHPGQAFR